ncbi:MAG: hypothetical protein ACRDOF_11100, partial [Gaiellaceae bacterium]
MNTERPNIGEGRASQDALPGLTRRDFVGRAAALVAGTSALGLLGGHEGAAALGFPGSDNIVLKWNEAALEGVRQSA